MGNKHLQRAMKNKNDEFYTDSKIDHGGNPVVDGHLKYVRIFIKNITI